jgi:flagellar biosynthesis anti-sigma factor FlgM
MSGGNIMRIDSNQALDFSGSQGTESRTGGQGVKSGQVAVQVGASAGQDQAELSGIHAQAQSLVAQVSAFPEVEQSRISALRQAVVSGTYRPSPEQVAGALFSNLVTPLAA